MPKLLPDGFFCFRRDPSVVWKRCIREMYRGVDSLTKHPNVWAARRRGIGKLDPETQMDGDILSDLANKTRYTANAVGLVRLGLWPWSGWLRGHIGDGEVQIYIQAGMRNPYNWVLTVCYSYNRGASTLALPDPFEMFIYDLLFLPPYFHK